MATDVREALRSILTALQTDFDVANALGATLAKKKELKAELAPLAAGFNRGMHWDAIAQIALELSPQAPLHVAMAALLAEGALPRTPWVSIAPAGQPERSVQSLHLDRSAPIVYAIEEGLRISAWSLDTGAHLADFAVPNDAKAAREAGVPGSVQTFVQRADGTLRVLTSQGIVADRALGAKAFTTVMSLGATRFGMAASPELDRFVTQVQFDAVAQDGVMVQRMRVHDAASQTSRDVIVPFDQPDRGWAWDGDAAWLGARRSVATGDENALVRIDARSGEVSSIAAPGELTTLQRVRPGVLLARLSIYAATGAEQGMTEIDLAARTFTSAPMPQYEPTSHYLRAPDGRAYDPQNRRFLDANGAVLVHYTLAGAPRFVVGVFDAARDRFVLAGAHPATPVAVIAPYAAERVAAMPPPVETRSLAWARPGAVLTYEIADFDAEDAYRFEVLAIEAGLALRITMNEDAPELVAERAVFTDAALASAKKQVAIAQGSADVDLAKEQSAHVPPIVVARAVHAKLAAGKPAPWKSAWSEAKSLEAGAKGPMSIVVDGADVAVATLRASGEGVELALLDDATWPLVLERVEGDCHVRLVSIDLARASTPTVAAPASSSGVRRFELVEGTSAKFWEVSVSGSELTTRFGKIGTSGQSSTKDLGSADAAAKEEAKLVREKTKKGYVAS